MMPFNRLWLLVCILEIVVAGCSQIPPSSISGYPIQPVPAKQVQLKDNFWQPRIEVNRDVTIPFGFEMCEKTGRIDNFRIAGGLKTGSFSTVYPFDDSDVYKIIEGASYLLERDYDPELDNYLDSLIFYIREAQTDDGYLQTWRIIDPDRPGDEWWGNSERWSAIRHGHELYNMGHLYEAAVAHYHATGKNTLLNVAIKNAKLIADTFGPDKIVAVPGHEEIEIGLVKLYRVTGNTKYLNLARFFIDRRGVGSGRELLGEYHQDHIPVREQRQATGHAVRACYLYSAMADLVAFTGDRSYLPALESIWEDVVYRKTYLTGGIGAKRSGESFGASYELPNATAYAETCAAIANVFWNHRMFLLKGEGRFIDILERTLYNGLLSGVSQSGDRFFYPNPLSSDGITPFNYGTATRQDWFPCACCPSNISRFIPTVPGYIYSLKNDTIFVNLYISSSVKMNVSGMHLGLTQTTDYPWEGEIKFELDPEKEKKFVLALRIPGWSVNKPVPGNLYSFQNPVTESPRLFLNGRSRSYEIRKGYLFLDRIWQSGDDVVLKLPVQISLVKAHPEIEANRNKTALQRGPLVYCLEAADNPLPVSQIQLDPGTSLECMERDIFGGIRVIKFVSGNTPCEAIPYFLWSNRGPNEMEVWIDHSD